MPYNEYKYIQDNVLKDYFDFYQSPLLGLIQAFLNGENKVEIDVLLRLDNASDQEIDRISQWAKEWFAKKTQSNDLTMRDYTWLGILHTKGFGVKIDGKFATECFQKASAKDAVALLLLAENTPHFEKAAELTQQAIEKGSISALHYMGYLLARHDPAKMGRYYKKAFHKEYSPSANALGLLYFTGSNNFEQNFKKSYHCFSQAAKKGCPEGLNHLGLMYFAGYYVKPNDSIAILLFEAALKRKNIPSAHLHLGMLYASKNKPEIAASHFCQAAKKNHKEAMYYLLNLFNQYTNNIEVCFYVAIGLKDREYDEAQQIRIAFNHLLTTHPQQFYDIFKKSGFLIETIQDLVDDKNNLEALLSMDDPDQQRDYTLIQGVRFWNMPASVEDHRAATVTKYLYAP